MTDSLTTPDGARETTYAIATVRDALRLYVPVTDYIISPEQALGALDRIERVVEAAGQHLRGCKTGKYATTLREALEALDA